MDSKRERGKNFTESEKESLIDVISNFKEIIENKKTDARNIRLKEDAWDAVTRQWNSVSVSGERKKEQLKMLYNAIKKRAKKNAAEDKKEVYKTGNLPIVHQTSELEKRVLAIADTESNAVGGVNDCDRVEMFQDFDYDLSQSAFCSSPLDPLEPPRSTATERQTVSQTQISGAPERRTETERDAVPSKKKRSSAKQLNVNKNRIKLEILEIRKEKELLEKDVLEVKKKKETVELSILEIKQKKELVELEILEIQKRKHQNEYNNN